MAKLSTLGSAIARAASDLFYGEQGGVEKKIRLDELSYEGTFTPVIEGSTTAGTNTYDIQSGYYTRIGKMVLVYGRVRTTAIDAAMAGSIRLAGLPFTVAGNSNGYCAGHISYSTGFTVIDSSYWLDIYAQVNSNYAYMMESNGLNVNAITETQLSASTGFMFSIMYEAA